MRIAVCDDEKIYTDAVCAVLERMKLSADVYSSGEELELSVKKYDLYILDIEMPGIDGMETASRIRREDEEAVIIFLTNHDSYVFKGYEVNAFRYIMKSRLKEKLPETLEKAVRLHEGGKKHILLKERGGEMRRIGLTEIVMAEKLQKKVLFHLTSGEVIEERMTIAEAEKLLDSRSFISVRKGVIINAQHIKRFEGMKLTMDTDEVCYISRGQMKAVKDRILRCWGE